MALDHASAPRCSIKYLSADSAETAGARGRSPDWLKMKNLNAPAVKREAEEDWGQ
jgi:hypothetical protein